MKCYYIIKLPSGGEVKIPATIPTIINEGETKELYESLLAKAATYYKDKSKIINEGNPLYKAILDMGTNILPSEIRSLMKKSNEKDLIDNLNTLINKSNRSDFETAVKRQIWKSDEKISFTDSKGKSSEITLMTFLTKLQTPIHKKYFAGISSEKLLNVKRLYTINKELSDNLEELSKIGWDSYLVKSLQNVLNAAFHSTNASSDIFFEISFNSDVNDAVVVKPENSTAPLIFFNGFNDLSLFVGALKYMGSTLDKDKLLPLLENYNKEVKDAKGKRVLTDENFDVNVFFTGSFEEDSKGLIKFIEPEFNKVLSNSTMILNEIIELVVDEFRQAERSKKELLLDFKRLVRHLNPETFGKYANLQDALLNQFFEEEKKDIYFSAQIKGDELKEYITKDNRDYYYSFPVVKDDFNSVQDLYYYLENNVTKNQDLVKVLIPDYKNAKEYTEYFIVPTEFKIVSKGIQVSGFYISNGGVVVTKNAYIFVNNENKESEEGSGEISYRKLISKNINIITENAEPIPSRESIVIISDKDEYLPPELVHNAATRGSTLIIETTKKQTKKSKKSEETEESDKVQEELEKTFEKSDEKGIYSALVKQVYPGIIKLNSFYSKKQKKIVDPFANTSKVKRMHTHRSVFVDPFTEADLDKRREIINDLDKVNVNHDSGFYPISVNDYVKSEYTDKNNVKHKVFNKVISVTDDSVYILIKTEKNYLAKAIPKNSIVEIYKEPVSFSTDAFKSIIDFYETIIAGGSISNFDYSSAESYEAAKDGDYVIYDKNSVYRITNKEKLEGIKLTLKSGKIIREYVKLPENKKVTVITTRQIDSPLGYHTALLNTIALFTEEEPIQDNEAYQEVRYFIPKKYKVNQMTLLPSGNLVGGILQTDSRKSIPNDYEDVTDELIALINENRNKDDNKASKLLIKRKGQYYERYNKSMYQSNFSTGNYDSFLNSNSYIELASTNNSSSSDGKIYKVLGISEEGTGNNSKRILNLEYSRFNNDGQIVTQHKQLDLSTEKSKIKWLYTMIGKNQTYQDIVKFDREQREKELKEKLKDKAKLEIERRNVLMSISNKLRTIFKTGIEVEVENHIESELKEKKAWVEATTAGVKVVLNLTNENASSVDVVHEYLHLFLMALKYNDIKKQNKSNKVNESITENENLYEKLLMDYANSIKQSSSTNAEEKKKFDIISQTNDLSIIEEYFVDDISKSMKDSKTNIDGIVNRETFKLAFMESLQTLNIESPDIADLNVFSLLNKKMSDIFKEESTMPISKDGLVLFELNFRNWLSDQINKGEIIIKC